MLVGCMKSRSSNILHLFRPFRLTPKGLTLCLRSLSTLTNHQTQTVPVLVEGFTDKKVLLSLCRLQQNGLLAAPPDIDNFLYGQDIEEHSHAVTDKQHPMSNKNHFTDSLQTPNSHTDNLKIPLIVMSCNGNTGVASHIIQQMKKRTSASRIALVDGDSVLPPLCKDKVKSRGIKYAYAQRKMYGQLSDIDPSWADLQLAELCSTKDSLPREPLSNVLLSEAAPTNWLKQRLNCKTFKEVISFYQDRLNVVCWTRRQLTLEDALLPEETDATRKDLKKFIIHAADHKLDALISEVLIYDEHVYGELKRVMEFIIDQAESISNTGL